MANVLAYGKSHDSMCARSLAHCPLRHQLWFLLVRVFAIGVLHNYAMSGVCRSALMMSSGLS